VLLHKSVFIILLKTVDSLMCIWDCGIIHNLVDECASIEEEEYQDSQDPHTDPDTCG
jgi:hypothetical protein